jgi:hypothetical protein
MSGINWEAAGISFGVCFVGGAAITYSFTLQGRSNMFNREDWTFQAPDIPPPQIVGYAPQQAPAYVGQGRRRSKKGSKVHGLKKTLRR